MLVRSVSMTRDGTARNTVAPGFNYQCMVSHSLRCIYSNKIDVERILHVLHQNLGHSELFDCENVAEIRNLVRPKQRNVYESL